MKSATTSAVSGCLVWVVACGVIGMCVLPVSMAIGGITSASDFASKFMGGFICPDGTTPESYSYATTTRDENGNSQPSTAYELHCVSTSGEIVKKDTVGYAFIWIAVVVVLGLVFTGILAFMLAAPVGVLISKLLNRMKKTNIVENIEPR